jgi:hypothetical protein
MGIYFVLKAAGTSSTANGLEGASQVAELLCPGCASTSGYVSVLQYLPYCRRTLWRLMLESGRIEFLMPIKKIWPACRLAANVLPMIRAESSQRRDQRPTAVGARGFSG